MHVRREALEANTSDSSFCIRRLEDDACRIRLTLTRALV